MYIISLYVGTVCSIRNVSVDTYARARAASALLLDTCGWLATSRRVRIGGAKNNVSFSSSSYSNVLSTCTCTFKICTVRTVWQVDPQRLVLFTTVRFYEVNRHSAGARWSIQRVWQSSGGDSTEAKYRTSRGSAKRVFAIRAAFRLIGGSVLGRPHLGQEGASGRNARYSRSRSS